MKRNASLNCESSSDWRKTILQGFKRILSGLQADWGEWYIDQTSGEFTETYVDYQACGCIPVPVQQWSERIYVAIVWQNGYIGSRATCPYV